MTFQSIIFYVFAAVLIISALRVITAKNPVHAAMFLVLSFFTAAALWLLIYAEFLAITLILVYVGAVMVLFLFVVMMLDINFDKLREGFWKHLPIAATVAILMVVQMALLLMGKAINLKDAGPIVPAAGASNTKELGRILYTDYLLPFELAAVVLLVAMVAAIALTLRGRKESKSQNVGDQVRVKAGDRLKIVKMDAVVDVPAAPAPEVAEEKKA
ncbi:MAG: NADH-quinone oxidoreductase subunit J [Betaproteobacteria bacterium]|nr:NADH-quinone oxidoreductase subunit J [Betaproteobacteria bacterium]